MLRFLDSLFRKDRLRARSARSVMTPYPVTCGNADSLEECAKLMYENNVGCLLVQNEKDEFVGILTDRDIVCAGVANAMNLKETPVSLIMDDQILSVRPEQNLYDVLRLMQINGIRRVPVMEEGSFLGMISIDDLILRRLCRTEDLAPIVESQRSEPNVVQLHRHFNS